MAVNVGSLVASLRADLSQWSSQFQKAGVDLVHFESQAKKVAKVIEEDLGKGATASGKALTEFQKHANNVTEALSEVGINTGLASRALAALSNPLVLAGVAFGAVTAGALTARDAMIANAKEVKALMAVSGLGAEEADNLADTFQLLGHDTGALTGALFKMGQQLDSGGAGFRKIGITYEEFSKVSNEGEAFLLVRDKISAMGTASERSAALMELFGRAGRELAPVFALSREKFAQFMATASELSPWSKEMQERTQELIIAQTKLGMSWAGLKIRAGEFLTGPGTAFLAWLNAALDGLQGRGLDFSPLANATERANAEARRTTAALAAQRAGERAPVAFMPDETRFREQRAQRAALLAQGVAEQIASQLAQEEEARRVAIELGLKTEESAVAERLAAVQRELSAKKAVFAEELKVAAEKDDLLGTKTLAVRQKIVQAEGDAAAKIAQIQNDGFLKRRAQILEEGKAVAEAAAKAAEIAVRQDEHVTEVVRDLTRERIAIHGTEEAAFIDAENEKARKAVEKLYEVLGETETAAELGVRIQELSAARIEAFRRQQDARRASLEADALRRSLDFSRTETERIEADARERFHALDALRANGLLGETDYQRAVQNLGRETTEKLRQGYQQDFQNRVAAQLQSKAAVEAFYTDETHIALASRAKDIQDGQALLQTKLGWLTTLNTASQAHAVAEAQILAQQKQAQGDYFGFVQAEFALVAAQGATVWQGLTSVVQEAAGHMKAAVSDFIFNAVTGAASLGDAFVNLGKAMLRTITNFLAEQAVKQFLGLLFGTGAAVGGSTGSAVAGSALAAAGVGVAGAAFGGGGGASASGGGAGLVGSVVSGAGFGAGLAGAFPGIVGIGSNFSAGGLGAVLLGQPSVTGELGLGAAGTSGLLGNAGAIGGVTAALGGLTAAFNVGMAAFGDDPTGASSIGTYAGTALGAAAGFALGGPAGAFVGAGLGSTIGGLIGGLFGDEPSARWLSFGSRLAETLQLEQSAAKTLADELQGLASAATVANRSETLRGVASAIQRFEDTVGARVGGFGAANPFEVAYLPGATGTSHEGGLVADFGPQVSALQNAVDAILGAYGTARLPSFGGGGIVPGPLGEPQLVLAHGGEEITPAHRRRGGVTIVVNALDASGIDQRTLDKITRAVRSGIVKAEGRSVAVGNARRG